MISMRLLFQMSLVRYLDGYRVELIERNR